MLAWYIYFVSLLSCCVWGPLGLVAEYGIRALVAGGSSLKHLFLIPNLLLLCKMQNVVAPICFTISAYVCLSDCRMGQHVGLPFIIGPFHNGFKPLRFSSCLTKLTYLDISVCLSRAYRNATRDDHLMHSPPWWLLALPVQIWWKISMYCHMWQDGPEGISGLFRHQTMVWK